MIIRDRETPVGECIGFRFVVAEKIRRFTMFEGFIRIVFKAGAAEQPHSRAHPRIIDVSWRR